MHELCISEISASPPMLMSAASSVRSSSIGSNAAVQMHHDRSKGYAHSCNTELLGGAVIAENLSNHSVIPSMRIVHIITPLKELKRNGLADNGGRQPQTSRKP
jgi:hypothetical protein